MNISLAKRPLYVRIVVDFDPEQKRLPIPGVLKYFLSHLCFILIFFVFLLVVLSQQGLLNKIDTSKFDSMSRGVIGGLDSSKGTDGRIIFTLSQLSDLKRALELFPVGLAPSQVSEVSLSTCSGREKFLMRLHQNAAAF